ncbi:MAG: capsid cement protein [Phascolarctobacterium sp.]
MANENALYRFVGKRLDYVCEGNVSRGDVIVVGSIVGVAEVPGTAGQKISLTTSGVFEMVTDGAGVDQGAVVYLKDGKVTKTAEGAVALGKAYSAAAATAGATVLVKIN